jgi:AraC-like DNA-binding protein
MQLVIGRGRYTPDVSSPAPLWVNNCGAYIDWQKNKRTLRPDGRADWQLILITEGRGFFTVDGKQLELPANSILLYPPHARQEYRFFKADSPSFWWVHFSGTLADSLCARLGADGGEPYSFPVRDAKRLIPILSRMHEHMALGEDVSEVFLSGCLCELIGECESERKRTSEHTDEDVERVCTYMKLHFKEHVGVDEYARIAGLSKYHFIRRFSAYTKKTPIEYVTDVRMQRARELLSGDELSVRECAEILGYSDQFYFCRVFKKHVGLSPAQFRRK